MAVLDSSIVNVALPHIMSAFEVNRDQVEWVTTAFMLATAVAMPLVGWLAGKIGYRTLYIVEPGPVHAGLGGVRDVVELQRRWSSPASSRPSAAARSSRSGWR